MVSFKSLAAALVAGLAAVPGTSAYIYNVTVPDKATAGQEVTATLYTSIYIQNYVDYGVIWGIGLAKNSCDDCVGESIGWTNLNGPGTPTVPPSGNFTVKVKIPEGKKGKYNFYAAVPFLVGASGTTQVKHLQDTIEIS